ncbi:MAG: SH3 domain-containing protein [Selenomonadaceae bacterium]|nr:SH3 domain-containing protein [Selenomonadaceae bacterium]
MHIHHAIKTALKKSALVLAAAALLASPSANAMETIVNQEGNLHVVGCDEWISLRSMPTVMDGEVLAHVPLGQLVHYIDDCDHPEFAHVSYNGIDGYALRTYLSSRATIYKVVRCDEWVSLRSAPSTDSDTLAQVPLDAYVIFVKAATDDFWYVNYRGTLGYVLRSYLD